MGAGRRVGTAGSPMVFWWLPAPSVYAVGLAFIAAVCLGFAVADGRRRVLVVEIAVLSGFVLLAAIGMTATPWLLVGGLLAHGVKDLWQHPTGFVANTHWWPPFCVTVGWLAALLIATLIMTGVIAR